MILVDTSVWVDHLRSSDPVLTQLLNKGQVLMHPFVLGEIAVGSLRQRESLLLSPGKVPWAMVADNHETLGLIEGERLFGPGIGYVDAHLLAAVRLTSDATLWTRDKQLFAIAERLSVAARVTH